MDKYLPQPTEDLIEAKKDLKDFGYCYVANALTKDEVVSVKTRLTEQANGERKHGVAVLEYEGSNQRMFALVNKGQVFRDLMMKLVVEEMARSCIGENFILSSLTANIAGKGGKKMPLHTDQMYLAPDLIDTPMVVNMAWLLDDFSEENGGTQLVPKSHLLGRKKFLGLLGEAKESGSGIRRTFIDNPEFKHEIISATAPAGTLLIFDGRTFHGTGKNLTENKRHAIFTYFCRTYIRQQENHFLSLPEEIRATSSDEFLDRLGFGTFRGLGAVEGNMEHGTKDKESVRGIERKIQSRPKNIIGELS
jgi:ectoine hydroxylase-related dioxygenase (phytanoyl-CoA dioxygenase family)